MMLALIQIVKSVLSLQNSLLLFVLDACPSSTSSCFFVLNQSESFLLLFDVVSLHGVLSHCITLGIVVKCHHFP